jgi:hypothetical protein
VKVTQVGSQVILVLLPGCQILENLPIKSISVIDLRYASWNKQGRDLLFPNQGLQFLAGDAHAEAEYSSIARG